MKIPMKFAIGAKFNHWTIIGDYQYFDNRIHDLCQCDCGKVSFVNRYGLTSDKSVGCGSCASKYRNRKHGLSQTNTYRIWLGVHARCDNPNKREYKYYGARGIKVCDRWLIYENFLADMGERPPGLELDRIDNDGNYCKENCRWVTHADNVRSMPRSTKLKCVH